MSENHFQLRAATAGAYTRGALGRFVLTLEPRGPYHLNQDFPCSVEVSGPSEITVPKPSLAKDDAAKFDERIARFDVPFTAQAAGSHQVRAKVSFAVCTDENCIPEERTVALALPVSAAKPEP